MAQDANTYDFHDLKGDREDLSDVIYNLYPTEAVLQSNFGLISSSTPYIEWQTDRLADPTDNAHVDGDNFDGYDTALTSTKRFGNYHQTSGKGYVVSRRAIIADKAGRADEMAYQVVKGLRELRNDVEFSASLRKAAVAGNSTTAPKSAGYPVWMRDSFNYFAGASSSAPTLSGTSDGYPNAIGNPGTARGFQENQFRTATRNVYDNANEMPDMFVLPPRVKQSFSEYIFKGGSNVRVASQRQDQGTQPGMGATVIGAVDLYTDDFGTIALVPSRFVPEGDGSDYDDATNFNEHSCELGLFNPDYWEFSHFSPFHVSDIGKNGDAERRLVIVDWSLKCKDPTSSAVITGINATTAVAA